MKTMIACVCTALLMLSASPAFAQCNNRGVIVRGNPVCSTPVIVSKHVEIAHEVITPVIYPVAVPVIVPAFTYQYVPPVSVSQAMPVYPGSPSVGHSSPYGSAGGYSGPYQQYAPPQPALPGVGNNDKLKELARLLLEEMRRQENPDDGGPPMALYPNNQPPVAAPQQNIGLRPNPQSQFAQPAINALARSCMACHTGPGSKGEVVIFSQQNILNPDAPFNTMLREVSQGRMPPRSSNHTLTQQEFQAISAWLEGR